MREIEGHIKTLASQDEIKGRTLFHIFSSIDRTRFIGGGPLLSTGALLSHRDTVVFPTVLSDPPIFAEPRLYRKVILISSDRVPCVPLLRVVNSYSSSIRMAGSPNGCSCSHSKSNS